MTTYKETLLDEIAQRRAYEVDKNESCESMKSHLDSYAKTLTARDALVDALCAANFDASALNRQERNNARFNIYAFAKVMQDVTVATMNHYSLAILRAAIALKRADLTLSHADAVAACSLDVAHKDKSRAAIIKSARYQKHVAINTATTQASSSINSLQALHVLIESRDSANHAVYTLTDSALASRMIERAAQ